MGHAKPDACCRGWARLVGKPVANKAGAARRADARGHGVSRYARFCSDYHSSTPSKTFLACMCVSNRA